jgi:class 3 adenylate cyclase
VGPLAIVYTDIAESTVMTQELGDAAAHELLSAHNHIVRAAVKEFRGAEVQALGDGFKLAFGTPRAAISCAVAIQSAFEDLNRERHGSGLAVRIGISIGEPIRQGGDIFGEAVIVAQRVMSRGAPGQILVSRLVMEQAGSMPAVRYIDRGLYHLKGLKQGVQLFEVAWAPRDVAPALHPRSVTRPVTSLPLDLSWAAKRRLGSSTNVSSTPSAATVGSPWLREMQVLGRAGSRSNFCK